MPKIKLGLNAQDKAALDKAAEENSFARYDGDIPPNGLYKAVIKTVNYMLSKEKQAPQLRAVVEIKEPAGSEKSEFNGYALFHYITLPVDPSYEYYGLQSAQTKEFLCALAGGDDAAWKGYKDDNMVGDESKTMKVTKFGTYSHNHKVGSPVKIMIEQDGEYKGQPNMRIKQFGLIKGTKPEVAASVEEPESIPLVEDDEPQTKPKPEPKEEVKREDVEPAAVETEEPVDSGDDGSDEDSSAGEQRDEATSDDAGSSDSGDTPSEAAPRRRRRRFADA